MRFLRTIAFWFGGPATGIAIGLMLTAAVPDHARQPQPTMVTPDQRAAPDLARFHGDVGAAVTDLHESVAALP